MNPPKNPPIPEYASIWSSTTARRHNDKTDQCEAHKCRKTGSNPYSSNALYDRDRGRSEGRRRIEHESRDLSRLMHRYLSRTCVYSLPQRVIGQPGLGDKYAYARDTP